MDITYILLKENPTIDSEALNKDINIILSHLDKGLTLIKAIYAEDEQPDPHTRVDLTLYLKWDSEDRMPPKHKVTSKYEKIIKEIPEIDASDAFAIVRVLGSNLIKVDVHYFFYNEPPKKSRKPRKQG